MFIETLEFTIPVDLCDLFTTLKDGTRSNMEFPASVNSYGTTQDASIQVALRSNKLTFVVDGVSSNASMISKSECKTLKLSVFDVDRTLIAQECVTTKSMEPPSPVQFPSKRQREFQISHSPRAKTSRTSFSDSPQAHSPAQNSKPSNDTPVKVKQEPEDPDLIEIEPDPEPDDIEPKKENPYMQIDYSSNVPHTQTSQAALDRVSFPPTSRSQSSSSSYHQNVPHVQDYSQPGSSHGDQSADDFLVFQDDNDYGDDNDNSADYSNDGLCGQIEAVEEEDEKNLDLGNTVASADQRFADVSHSEDVGNTSSNRRFADVSHVEVDEQEAHRGQMNDVCLGTKRSTVWGVNILKQWLQFRGESEDFENFDASQLKDLLCRFYAEVRNANGQLYSRSSYVGLRAALQRYLSCPPYSKPFNIIHGHEFQVANQAFNRMLKDIQEKGTHKPSKYIPLTAEDIARVREHQSTDTPDMLMSKVWFDTTLGFGRRMTEHHHELKKDAFIIKTDENGLEYITLSDSARSQKTDRNLDVHYMPRIYSTGNRLCPVLALKKYFSKLNPYSEYFYQYPSKQSRKNFDVWYSTRHLGHNGIGGMMKEISRLSGLAREYTNYSLRTTIASLLNESGVDNSEILRLTGFRPGKTLDVVNLVDTLGDSNMRRHYSNIVQGICESEPGYWYQVKKE